VGAESPPIRSASRVSCEPTTGRHLPTYDRRYEVVPNEGGEGVIASLCAVARKVRARRALEVGCGTGFWMAAFEPFVPEICGLDFSAGMLAKARERDGRFRLVRGTASRLPFVPEGFDLVFSVNAIHHFDDPEAFVAEARRVLGFGGSLVVIGMNPHAGRDRGYLGDYFPGILETDLDRYPSAATVTEWMKSAGFDLVESGIAHRIRDDFVGREVLEDPSLEKNGTSQLALLSDEDYAAGIARIHAALDDTEASGKKLVFPVDISLAMVTGYITR